MSAHSGSIRRVIVAAGLVAVVGAVVPSSALADEGDPVIGVQLPVTICNVTLGILGSAGGACPTSAPPATIAINLDPVLDGSILNGNTPIADVYAPVTVCGDAVAVLDTATGSCPTAVPPAPAGGTAPIGLNVPVVACGVGVAVAGNAAGSCGGPNGGTGPASVSVLPQILPKGVVDPLVNGVLGAVNDASAKDGGLVGAVIGNDGLLPAGGGTGGLLPGVIGSNGLIDANVGITVCGVGVGVVGSAGAGCQTESAPTTTPATTPATTVPATTMPATTAPDGPTTTTTTASTTPQVTTTTAAIGSSSADPNGGSGTGTGGGTGTGSGNNSGDGTSLPTTGIAVGLILAVGVGLSMTGFGSRLLSRVGVRRQAA